ncbi:DUF4397 domain-containing protein [Nocardioides zeae]|uniref:DUF4397 domain-containing protein n=1 Tax=Nocardioides imazamoxiresistens TaxID=3231893 RepID=A0ABU3Q0D0_9ACTN|nr:DUF4397 domain-containing protein [Nocardioides zeae]MDT9594965.1 DUF4397 domain-containing protein [Nocardioides zeae]
MTTPTPRADRTTSRRTSATRLAVCLGAPLALGCTALAVAPGAQAAPATPVPATAPGTDAPGTEAAETTGWVRAGHLSPGTPKADVTLTPFSGGDPVTIRGVAFSDVTDYLRVPQGLYTLAIRAEDQPDSQPMVTANVQVDAGSASTVIATGEDGPAQVQVVTDDLTPPADDKAKVRLISAASTSEPVTATVVDGPVLADEVTTGSATGYAEVEAQTWDIDVTAGDVDAPASSIPVEAGGVYTLLVLGDDAGGLELQAIQDSAGSGPMPQGGVDTGAGGLAAPTGTGTGAGGDASALLAPAAGTALAVALGGALVLRTRTRRHLEETG